MEINFNRQDLEEFKELVIGDAFSKFLLSNTSSFSVCACVMQTLFNKYEEIKQILEAEDEGE